VVTVVPLKIIGTVPGYGNKDPLRRWVNKQGGFL